METFLKTFQGNSFGVFSGHLRCISSNNGEEDLHSPCGQNRNASKLQPPFSVIRTVLKSMPNTTETLYTYDNAIHGLSTRVTPKP
ncbi:hypothetical protein Fmac_002347 [Flemingia macrophylla]|uniref:Uncharacterized protein n=1 Tax=Flemingia macrophylla TaxID=520843 RepID=A0ABD1NL15_9FABA